MRRGLHIVAFLALLSMVSGGPVRAAEIVLEHSAVDKLLARSLFNDAGRHYFFKGTCHAYLENPTVELKEGRVWIRSHLSSRTGVPFSGRCLGVSLAAWTVVSGRPVSSHGTIGLDDIRIDQVDDGATRALLNSGLVPALPHAIGLDVLTAVRAMLQGDSGQVQSTVESLTVESVTADDDKLSVKFDFKLVGK